MNKENAGHNSTKQGRQILKQYLQEIGYTDTIIDVRSARLRTLLGLKSANPTSQNNSAINLISGQQQQQQNNDQFELIAAANLLVNNQADPLANLLNGSRQLLQLSNGDASTKRGFNANDVPKLLNLTESDAQSMLMMTNLDFITNQMESGNKIAKSGTNSNGNDNDDDDECLNEDEGDRTKLTTQHQQMSDSETEDALKEFSFLSNELSSGHEDGYDNSSSSDWNVDKAKIIKLTEQDKKDRKSSKNANKQQSQQVLTSHTATSSSQRPNKAALQAMIANLNENTNESGSQQQNKNETSGIKLSPSSNNSTSHQLNNINFSNSTKLFLEEDGLANDSSLGELSRISVNNNNNSSLNISGVNDETIIEVSGV